MRYRWRSAAAGAVGALVLAACGNETDSPPPDRVTPADAVVYVEVDLTLAGDQEKGLAELVENATGDAPKGDPLLAAVDALTDGKAGPLTQVRGDLGWLGDRIAYVSVPPMREQEDHGIVAIVKDGGDAVDAIAEAMGEKPRDAELAGRDVSRLGKTGFYAAEVEDYVVAGGRGVVEKVLRAADGGRTLADDQTYRRAMQGRGRQLAAAFIDLPKAARLSAKVKGEAVENLGRKALAKPYAYGIDFKGDTATFDQLIGGTELDGIGVTPLVTKAPADAWLALGFRDLREKGTDMLSDAASWMELPDVAPGQARKALASVGIDLDRDVFGWMGDGALWAAGENGRSIRFGLLLEAVRPAQARAALAKLRSLMDGEGSASDFTVRYPDGARMDARLAGGIVRLTYATAGAKATKGTVMDGPLGKAAAPGLDGKPPALLADARTIERLVRETGDTDADIEMFLRFLKPFTIISGAEGPKGNPRIIGRIR